MKSTQIGILCVLVWLGAMPAQATDRWASEPGHTLFDNMWRLMEWYSGRQPLHSAPHRGGHSPRWQDDWSELGSLEGVWLAQSGEYWVVRRGRFVLIQPSGDAVHGEYQREGHFLRVFGPWGEQRFEFRQMGDVIMVQDVHGQVGLLRRVQAAHWAW